MSDAPKTTSEGEGGDGDAKPSFKDKFMGFVQEYGPIAFVTWFGIFFLTWGGFILAIQFGLDVGREAADVSADGGAAETGGVVAGAYVATQLTKPIRAIATFALTPVLARLWARLRGGEATDEASSDDA
ncbi:MAG: DUF1279 domain-containing protein [Myxococcota bacterium]